MAKKLVLTEKFRQFHIFKLCIIILVADIESYSCLFCRIESTWQLVRFKEDIFLRIKKEDLLNYDILNMTTGQVQGGSS